MPTVLSSENCQRIASDVFVNYYISGCISDN
jgi:hypothetical protein